MALVCGSVAAGVAFSWPKKYIAKTLLVYQMPKTNPLAAMPAATGLSDLATGGGKVSGEQLAALIKSRTVVQGLIDELGLTEFGAHVGSDRGRKRLLDRIEVTVGRKDGTILVEVSDPDPNRAAQISNRLIDGLKTLTSSLTLTEAKSRRLFYEKQLQGALNDLSVSRQDFRSAGFDENTIKLDPKSVAQGYSSLKSELDAAEIRLQSVSGMMTAQAPEARLLQARIQALRKKIGELAAAPQENQPHPSSYSDKYRQYRSAESVVDYYYKQLDVAKMDEAREGDLWQVVDRAYPPTDPSGPNKLLIILVGLTVGAALGLARSIWHAKPKYS